MYVPSASSLVHSTTKSDRPGRAGIRDKPRSGGIAPIKVKITPVFSTTQRRALKYEFIYTASYK